MSSGSDLGPLLDRADQVFEEGSEQEVVETLEELEGALGTADLPADRVADLRFAIAGGRVVLGEHGKALDQYHELRALGLDEPELDHWEAVSLFHLWRFDEARQLLPAPSPGAELEAAAVYYQGLLAEFAGEWERADRLFARAARLEPESYHRPHRLPDDKVRDMLEDLVQVLPEDVSAALHNVQVCLCPLPERAVHDHPGVDPLVLGLYTGRSLMDRDPFGGADLPERVEVFQRNVERVVRDEAELRHELEVTLKHEIGHHLGWDEDDLAERGLA